MITLSIKDPKLWELWYIPYYGKDPKLWELWYIPYYGKDPKLWEVFFLIMARTLNYGNYGIFLIMGSAGFISSLNPPPLTSSLGFT